MGNWVIGKLNESRRIKRKDEKIRVSIKLVEILPRTKAADVIGKQLLRSATSIGANYRSACRAKSQADFISKIATVEEEADETIYWLELMIDSKLINGDFGFNLRKEASELTAIFSTSRKSARNNQSANRKL